MYRIGKRFGFSASHSLPSLPEEHQCHRMHGHNYVVELELEGTELNRHGMLRDYGELDRFKDWLKDTLDHRTLNDYMESFLDHRESTAENLAFRLLWGMRMLGLSEVCAVRVKETDNTWAECRR